MKRIIKKILIKIFDPIHQRLGYMKKVENVNVSSDKSDLLNNLIGLIKYVNYRPKLILDVGANHGTWSRVWKKAFENSRFILVEPQYWIKASFEDLLDDKTLYLPIGAGNKEGSFKFTINSDRDDSSTFYLDTKEADAKGFRQIDVPVKTINSIVKESGFGIPDIIKIDAEGIDIEVIEGASDCYGKTEIFLIEANINGVFKETSLLNVINYMDKIGYRPFEITDINRPFSNNVLWLLEIAFIKKNGYFDKLNWQ